MSMERGRLARIINKLNARPARFLSFSANQRMDKTTLTRKIYIAIIFTLLFFAAASGAVARDFLTAQENVLLQKNQDIDKRTGIFMDAAALRLGTALDRFEGRESEPGAALEFFSQEEMLDDYCKIIDNVMLVVGDAFESPRRKENTNIKKALQTLKSESSGNLKKLAVLKNFSEEKRKKELLNRVNQAIEVTEDLLDGAEEGLAKLSGREREGVRGK